MVLTLEFVIAKMKWIQPNRIITLILWKCKKIVKIHLNYLPKTLLLRYILSMMTSFKELSHSLWKNSLIDLIYFYISLCYLLNIKKILSYKEKLIILISFWHWISHGHTDSTCVSPTDSEVAIFSPGCSPRIFQCEKWI